ncbi:hypothetical protein [Streptomyces sp. NBC_00690]|uniref:hypothetical protein n=1 Tax=Streptomyces sp. NBC_00690 TaxID=2975808 RepID=UPI002E287CBC|nr:hypothetical protein [Streptomyces sp. NBC_00690]
MEHRHATLEDGLTYLDHQPRLPAEPSGAVRQSQPSTPNQGNHMRRRSTTVVLGLATLALTVLPGCSTSSSTPATALGDEQWSQLLTFTAGGQSSVLKQTAIRSGTLLVNISGSPASSTPT